MKPHEQLFLQQLEDWPEAAAHYRQLSATRSRTLELNEQSFVLQSNPGRIKSSLADVSSNSLKQRPCFLCPENRPAKQQTVPLYFDPSFEILINPYPVARRHYTIAGPHLPQRLRDYLNTFFSTAQIMDDCVVFFNGAYAGASAPDHLHFQSIIKGVLPLEKDIYRWKESFMKRLVDYEDNTVSCLSGIERGGWYIEGSCQSLLKDWVETILTGLAKIPLSNQSEEGIEEEPSINFIGWFELGRWNLVLFPRKAHRPSCYFAPEPKKLLVSPASLEMGGLFILARPADFEKITTQDICTIYQEVAYNDITIKQLSDSLTFSHPS
jgi:hypothetical protein